MNKIYVVIISKDEAIRIAGAVASAVDFVDEVLVVDSGSSDDTVEISVANRVRVVENVWPGFAEQRNLGAAAAKSALVFILDADETFDADLFAFVVKFVSESANDTFAFTRIGDFLGRQLTHQDRVKQIYQNKRRRQECWQLEVHKSINVSSDEIQSGKDFGLHYGFRRISDCVRQSDRFTGL
jgi:glycosyltransferase involved in cell wall biosynthesis